MWEGRENASRHLTARVPYPSLAAFSGVGPEVLDRGESGAGGEEQDCSGESGRSKRVLESKRRLVVVFCFAPCCWARNARLPLVPTGLRLGKEYIIRGRNTVAEGDDDNDASHCGLQKTSLVTFLCPLLSGRTVRYRGWGEDPRFTPFFSFSDGGSFSSSLSAKTGTSARNRIHTYIHMHWHRRDILIPPHYP